MVVLSCTILFKITLPTFFFFLVFVCLIAYTYFYIIIHSRSNYFTYNNTILENLFYLAKCSYLGLHRFLQIGLHMGITNSCQIQCFYLKFNISMFLLSIAYRWAKKSKTKITVTKNTYMYWPT